MPINAEIQPEQMRSQAFASAFSAEPSASSDFLCRFASPLCSSDWLCRFALPLRSAASLRRFVSQLRFAAPCRRFAFLFRFATSYQIRYVFKSGSWNAATTDKIGSSARFARAEAYGMIVWDYITGSYYRIILRDNITG